MYAHNRLCMQLCIRVMRLRRFVAVSEELLTRGWACVTTRTVGCASSLLLATQRAAGKAQPLPGLAPV